MGDVYADAGLGMSISLTGWSIRFYGLNAPEINSPDPAIKTLGLACRDYLKTLVGPGQWLSVTSMGFDKYGRRIDGVPITEDGKDLCALMLLQPGVVVMQ